VVPEPRHPEDEHAHDDEPDCEQPAPFGRERAERVHAEHGAGRSRTELSRLPRNFE
jgi:hypothetical protein